MNNKLSSLITKDKGYEWRFCSVGGVIRVIIETGEDIRHLPELDQKLWTVLSCPTKGLEFPEKTLQLLDTDNDNKIRVNEVVSASQWLCNILRDPQLLISGGDGLKMDDFSDSEEGKRLQTTAKQILESLGIERDTITIADTSDSIAIFAKTRFNGDGIITANSTDDESLKDAIAKIVEKMGSVTDRSGEEGINQEILEKFFQACTDYSAWSHAAASDLPYGDDTDAALAAVDAIKSKMADYFMRCKLIAFDEDTAAALGVQVAKIETISGNDLSACTDEIASYPLARPNKDCLMLLDGVVNPTWKAAFADLKTHVLDKEFADKESITEEEWNAVVSKFDAYVAWKDAKAGAEVEEIGIEAIDKMLADEYQSKLQALIDQDNAVADEVNAIAEVDKLLYLKRDYYKLLCNYVTMADFYSRKEGNEAVFQCGRLFIDQRCLDLCIRVEDMSKQAEMASLSGMYLLYCTCTSKVKNATMNIVAVLTDGDVDNMRVGKNAIFYDRSGQDWDAVVTKIVDNPVSIRQAFWSPYRKLGRFITDKINKNAAEKEAKSMQNLTAKTDTALVDAQAGMAAAQQNPNGTAQPKAQAPQPFDIAKFAGIFAALGMALGMIGAAIMAIIDPWYNIFILLGVLVLCTSGPSMFIAWTKLRKRNLGPVLNANGWAINSKLLVNILFGQSLTGMAKYPKLDLNQLSDPFTVKTPWWKKLLRWGITGLVLLGIVWVILLMFHLGPYAKYYTLTVTPDKEVAESKLLVMGGGKDLKDMKKYDIIAKDGVVIDKDTFYFKGWSDITNKSVDGQRDSLSYKRQIQLVQDSNIIARFDIHKYVAPVEETAETPAAE